MKGHMAREKTVLSNRVFFGGFTGDEREKLLYLVLVGKSWGKVPTSTGAGFLNHQQYERAVKPFTYLFLQGQNMKRKSPRNAGP